MTQMLERTRDLVLPPSSNPPDPLDTSWLHLLPSLEVPAVVPFGDVSLRLLDVLRARGSEILDARDLSHREANGIPTECLVLIDATSLPGSQVTEALHHLGDRVDTVVLTSQHASGGISADAAQPAIDLVSMAGPSGLQWWSLPVRTTSSRHANRARKVLQLVAARIGRHDRSADHASDLTPYAPAAFTRTAPRSVVVGTRHPLSELPTYLTELAGPRIAANSGAWSFGPARGFRSQKVVFLIEDSDIEDGDGAGLVVKATQDPTFNRRLEAEADALIRLRALRLSHLNTPRVVFSGWHGELFHLGQSKLTGVPFRSCQNTDTDDGPFAWGLAALFELATKTATAAEPGALAAAAHDLVERHQRIFDPPESMASGLQALVERVGGARVPGVLMHGDFGVWNTFADDRTRTVGALDWENADPVGVPLWDAFVFARTFGVFTADMRGIRYGPAQFRRQLLEPSPLHRRLAEHVESICRSFDIAPEVVADLFALCWVQQSVREAATLPSPTVDASANNRYLAEALRTPFTS